MIAVTPQIYVTDEHDCKRGFIPREYAVIHALKFPCHARLLHYKAQAPRTSPEYLVARRGDHLYLNLIDTPDPSFISERCIEAALDFMDEYIEGKSRIVCVHCNEGRSRSPSIALMYLARRTELVDGDNLDTAIATFKEMYPAYNPGYGMQGYIKQHWPFRYS